MERSWILFSDRKPEPIVKWYNVLDSNNVELEVEWYEGSGFQWVNSHGGMWCDEENEEVTNVVYWEEK